MIDISKKIITHLQSFLREAHKNIGKYRQKPTDFTRNRKLPFKTLCKFLSKLLKKVYKVNSIVFLQKEKLAQNLHFAKPEKS